MKDKKRKKSKMFLEWKGKRKKSKMFLEWKGTTTGTKK